MDVCAQKILFSCGPDDGEKLFDPRAFGREGLDFRGKIWPKKFKFMLFFCTENICYASWGPIFLDTPRNPDNERPRALNRQLNN